MTAVKEAPSPKVTNGPGQIKEITPRATTAVTKHYATPFAMMRRFADEMDRIFEDFGFGSRIHFPSFVTRGRELLRREVGIVPAEWSPKVDVVEREGCIVVRVDLPGMTKDEVKVEIGDDALIISGERKVEKKEEREGYCYNECSYGSFYRAIPLPEGVESGKATADIKHGVLEVTVPIPPCPEKKARRLEVREGK